MLCNFRMTPFRCSLHPIAVGGNLSMNNLATRLLEAYVETFNRLADKTGHVDPQILKAEFEKDVEAIKKELQAKQKTEDKSAA